AVPRQQRYSAVTPAIRSQRQLHAIPHFNRLMPPFDRDPFEEERQRNLAFDAERFPRLVAAAAHVLEEQEITNGKPLEKILALERHFHVHAGNRGSANS